MAKNTFNGIRLGVFVVAGMAFLVLLLYVIGKNQNLFGSTFTLKARFDNVQGLMKGNNIRYAGINAGTVSDVTVLNDTTIEVTMLVKTKMKDYIHENALVSISTDGIIGNKLLNIEPLKDKAPLVPEGYIFYGRRGPDTDEMLRILSGTNQDIAVITKELKQTVQRINSSKVIWSLLNDESLPASLRVSLMNIKAATSSLGESMNSIRAIVNDVENGKGTVGKLLKDSSLSVAITDAFDNIAMAGTGADSLFSHVTALADSLNDHINNGKGIATALLKDSMMKTQLHQTIMQIEKDAASLDEIMKAVKQSILFRGYFNKKERERKKHPVTTGF
jgi:phospholipid/cholesterol/gamma-HCH transport system substrate-binding protein